MGRFALELSYKSGAPAGVLYKRHRKLCKRHEILRYVGDKFHPQKAVSRHKFRLNDDIQGSHNISPNNHLFFREWLAIFHRFLGVLKSIYAVIKRWNDVGSYLSSY